MKLIKPSFEIIEQEYSLEGIYKQIELAGRTCYKSEDKITETSAKEFVERMVKSGHNAMLEHGTVCLYINDHMEDFEAIVNDFERNKYSKTKLKYSDKSNGICRTNAYIATNYRILIENGWLEDLKYLCEPTEYHEKRYTVKFTCDRGVSHEFVRHRVFSFAQESTRYCNYAKDRFENELTFIIPCWTNLIEGSYNDNLGYDYIWQSNENKNSLKCSTEEGLFMGVLNKSEQNYIELLDKGWKPQQARSVLPNALKTELVMTGFASDWKGFFKLRADSHAHPQAQELAYPLKEEFKIRGYI